MKYDLSQHHSTNKQEDDFMSRRKVYQDSAITPFINDYIRVKKGLGFSITKVENELRSFDSWLREKGYTMNIPSKELITEWCAKRLNEKHSTCRYRTNAIRQLLIHMFNLGYDVYIPATHNRRFESTSPYIYSDKELSAIIDAMDYLSLEKYSPKSCIFSVPALFRMLIGTGIRIGEAVELLDKDVDLKNNYIVLRDTKNLTDRIVPISQSLSEVCKQYKHYKSLLPFINSDRFFVKLNGTKCDTICFSQWWHKILRIAGIPHLGKQFGPRIHDLRHTFCVKTLAHLAREGKDLYYILPILSTYIGHMSLSSTDKYVRLVSELYPELLSQTDSVCTYIYSSFKR